VALIIIALNPLGGLDLAQDRVAEETKADIERINKRLDMLDDRLDSIDSMVTAVAERVMRQPVTLNVTCSKCGQNIEIALLGLEKPKK
jgi:hypothetical protein